MRWFMGSQSQTRLSDLQDPEMCTPCSVHCGPWDLPAGLCLQAGCPGDRPWAWRSQRPGPCCRAVGYGAMAVLCVQCERLGSGVPWRWILRWG